MTSERIQRQIDSLLDQAEAAIAQGDWELARERASGALAFDTDNQDARAFLEAADQQLDDAIPPTASTEPRAGESTRRRFRSLGRCRPGRLMHLAGRTGSSRSGAPRR